MMGAEDADGDVGGDELWVVAWVLQEELARRGGRGCSNSIPGP